MLSCFRTFSQHLPFLYRTFWYRKSEFADDDKLAQAMKRDVTMFLFDHLERFQAYGQIKIYYDNGQKIVTDVLHNAIGYVVDKNARTQLSTAMLIHQVTDCSSWQTMPAALSSLHSSMQHTNRPRPMRASLVPGGPSKRTSCRSSDCIAWRNAIKASSHLRKIAKLRRQVA
ncbi:MAG: hypothetical protein ACI361_08500, partial [Atopobiaceae bacterium]